MTKKEKTTRDKFNSQLQLFYDNRKMKKYYGTTEVMSITGISLRTVRYRLSELKVKYANVDALLFKENHKWKIHRSLLEEFLPHKTRATSKIITNWNSFITWTTVDNYDDSYHNQIFSEIKSEFPENLFLLELENNKKGIRHAHVITDTTTSVIGDTVDKIINEYLSKTNYRLEVGKIRSKVQTRCYMNK